MTSQKRAARIGVPTMVHLLHGGVVGGSSATSATIWQLFLDEPPRLRVGHSEHLLVPGRIAHSEAVNYSIG